MELENLPGSVSMDSVVMESWHSYPSIYAMGHRAIASLLKAPVYVEEKVDGSQFSFGISADGELKARSKGAVLYFDAPEKMFTKAIETVRELSGVLHSGWTYRGEFLSKPKHNTLVYNRVPLKHIIIFDINTGAKGYLPYAEKLAEAQRIGLECVPLLHEGIVASAEMFRAMLDRESVLGGQKIEGVVVKPVGYSLFGLDKKCLLGKFVSEHFKETHSRTWKETNQGPIEITQKISETFSTPARWQKSIQHLREAGQLEGSPRDIGKLIGEIQNDVKKECREEILDMLWKWAWPQIVRRSTHGLPEWYKEQLLKEQFNEEPVVAV